MGFSLLFVSLVSILSITERPKTHPPEMFWIFGIYKKDTNTTEVSVSESEGSDSPSAEIRAMGSAECKTAESQTALSEDMQSDMNSDTDSDDTNYDGMYSDGTDSDVMDSDGESSDVLSSEDEGPSPKGNTRSSSRQCKLRVPSLAEIYLRSQSQRDRIHTDEENAAVITLRHEHHKRHLIEQAEALSAHSSFKPRSYQTSSPCVKPQA